MTAGEALKAAFAALKRHRCPEADPMREAGLFLSLASGLSPEDIAGHPEREMDDAAAEELERLVSRRQRHEPVEMILGWADFCGLRLTVTPDTLIPRPATELLVERAVEDIERPYPGGRGVLAVDVGTGSGAAALALSRRLPAAAVIGTDISAAALLVAEGNAAGRPERDSRLRFSRGDLLDSVRPDIAEHAGTLAVFANLPYLPEGQWECLPQEIRNYEPKSALLSGPDGLSHYRRLIDQLAELDHSPLIVFLEILPEQYGALAEAISEKLPGLSVEPIENSQGTIYGLKAA